MYYFIVNEHGGGGKAVRTWRSVQAVLAERGVPYRAFSTGHKGHATQIAQDISRMADDDKRLVVVGGDGTINEVLNGIADFDGLRFAVVPSGSGNDFVRGLRVPRSPRKALRSILDAGGCRDIDLGLVQTEEGRHVFGISAGMGLDAIVCRRALSSRRKNRLNKVHLGSLTYLVLTVQTLFGMKTERVTAAFDDGSRAEFDDLIFLACMNFAAEGGGVRMCPQARGDDGELSICAASGIPRWKTFLLLPALVLGLHGGLRGFTLRNCRSVDIESVEKVMVHTDGEYAGYVRHVHVECLKGRLHYMM